MTRAKTLAVIGLCIAMIAASATQLRAEPVADSDRIPIDLRRTTLVVEDTERSLAFYRDVLGMVVIYDNMLRTPRDAKSDEEAERSSRLVFLRANDDFIGILGLLEYTKPRREADPQDRTPFQPGDIVLVFNTDQVDEAIAKASELDGVEIRQTPVETTYPSYDGEGVIRVKVSVVLDPDGHAIELNQILDGM